MEIAGFGMINPEDYRLSSLSATRNQSNFEQLLRRTSAAESTVNTRPGQSDIDKNDKLYQLCLELETFLVKNLLNSMRSTVQKSGLVDDSFAGQMYEDMLYEEYAKDFTRGANFGLAEQAYRQLTRKETPLFDIE
ncbi:MAG: rod-binding protein [Treponema sp.]|nr:rod-binding protein [Treponema sp.]